MKPITIALLALMVSACGSDDQSSDGTQSVWPHSPAITSENSQGAGDIASLTSASSSSASSSNDSTSTRTTETLKNQPTTGCDRFYVQGKKPQIVDAPLSKSLAPRRTDLCYLSYAVSYSGVTRTPLWVAEALTPSQISAARNMVRHDEFRPDPDIKTEDSAQLSDYRGSGFDRGHMAPSGDMPTVESQSQSFYLINIVPQDAALNRGKWEQLETSVRRQALRKNVYILTGPIFQHATQSLHNRVVVPTLVFKGIYIDGQGAVIYVAQNIPNGRWSMLSVDEFKNTYGIDLFPGLPADVRSHKLTG